MWFYNSTDIIESQILAFMRLATIMDVDEDLSQLYLNVKMKKEMELEIKLMEFLRDRCRCANRIGLRGTDADEMCIFVISIFVISIFVISYLRD